MYIDMFHIQMQLMQTGSVEWIRMEGCMYVCLY